MNIKFLADGNICSPKGFLASAVHCGLKKSGRADLCLIFSESPALATGAFTSNRFCAAPVTLSKNTIKKSSSIRAVVVNSGNANACTGSLGMKNAKAMLEFTAENLGISSKEVLVCSTGRIGIQMPMEKIRDGIIKSANSLDKNKGSDAASAIMTTDLVKKECAISFKTQNGEKITIGAMTKGSGMIAPQMLPAHPHATMLSFITTDANLDKDFLRESFNSCVSASFNKISVDGDMSTNDSVILLSNGTAKNNKIKRNTADANTFTEALHEIMTTMAKSIVLDGEGASKFVTIEIENARTEKDAELCARAISNSMLCKTAWFGGDPNWGRILAAAGYSGAKFNPSKVDLHYNKTAVISSGKPVDVPETKLAKEVAGKNLIVRLKLGAGNKSCTMWTSDLSYDYVKINADYRT